MWYLSFVLYFFIRSLRASEPSQLLINLCFGYLGIYVMYIISYYSTSIPDLCVAAGALVQYFMLVTFLVMVAEAVNLFMKLVLVFASIQRYVLKVTIVAWSKSTYTTTSNHSVSMMYKAHLSIFSQYSHSSL